VPAGTPHLVRRVAILASTALLAGCSADQSTLRPESDAAHSVATMWWILLAGSTVVVAVVTLLVVLAVLRRRGEAAGVERGEARGARTAVLVSGALVPTVVLVALFAYVLSSLDATAQPRGGTAFTINVVGKQWFWHVRYRRQRIVTANEIHVPVGVPVKVVVSTADVIHSFWVPRLNRKIDTIPGRRNSLLIRADRPGVYRGQCAEYCGLQHANMAFFVIAQRPREFRRWVAREQRPTPSDPAGARMFRAAGCGGCHAVAGVSDATIGPDLTHVGSRRTLAAGTIANTTGDLGAWIIDPQHVKPGNKMPGLPLRGEQVQQLVDYLQALR
jgi:cytochrome c oxidase subunit II